MILDFSSRSKFSQHSTIALYNIGSLTLLIKSISLLIKISSGVKFNYLNYSCSSICLSSSAIVSSTYLTSLSCPSRVNEPLIYACLILSLFACWLFIFFSISYLGLDIFDLIIGRKNSLTTESYSNISPKSSNIDSSI
mgnify:CR=1 FL=1